VNLVHKYNNLKSSYHFFKNFLARCASSISFYPLLRNESMQCALPTPFIYFCFGGLLSLTDSFQNSIVQNRYTMSKNCLRGVAKRRGKDVRMGGNSAMVVGGIDAPGYMPVMYECYSVHTLHIEWFDEPPCRYSLYK